MKTVKHMSLWLIGALCALMSYTTQLKAADHVELDIRVSIAATKEVTVDTTFYYFGAIAINTSSNSATPIEVSNASSGLIETYTIKGGDAISDTVGQDWTLTGSTATTGSAIYALAAQFKSSRPDNAEENWLQDDLNRTTAVTCTTAILGDGTAGDEGAGVNPSDVRYLYFRLKTPTNTSDGGAHTAQLTLSVL